MRTFYNFCVGATIAFGADEVVMILLHNAGM